MTTAHVEKFAELVAKDPALLAKLGLDKVNADAAAAAASAAAFLTNAVKEAKALAIEFTEEELNAFMAAEKTAAASGELSDPQLEAVAGGDRPDEMLEAMLGVSSPRQAAMENKKDALIGANQSHSTARKQQAQKAYQKLGQ